KKLFLQFLRHPSPLVPKHLGATGWCASTDEGCSKASRNLPRRTPIDVKNSLTLHLIQQSFL
ncbi:hypothetical protein R0K30_21840, partial [Bacillus sp. SIMBA_154]|uniref:hypothetical protein n=1 Tax=Bacillus sp. SIMBA_154 TaxID=3080859 RepID=UPI0039798206